jgi:hypothetical protein
LLDALASSNLTVVLAAFQLARFVTVERGPFDVFRRVRDFGGKYTTMAACPYCQGFWYVVVLTLLWDRVPWARYPVRILSLVGAHTLVQQVSQRLDTY